MKIIVIGSSSSSSSSNSKSSSKVSAELVVASPSGWLPVSIIVVIFRK